MLLAISAGLGATWAAHALGISPALGAFVAGMLLGESPFATQIRSDIGALRTMMVTLFFASVGMLAKPMWFLAHIHWVVTAALGIFIFKAGLIFCVTRIFGLNRRHALATGICLAQIGEFSFVLATAARDGGVLDGNSMDLVFSVIIVLMLATPYMVSWAVPLSDRLFNGKGKKGVSASAPTDDPAAGSRSLVVGFGPDPETARQVIATIRGLRPDLTIVARCRYNRHLADLARAGASLVIDEETTMGEMLSQKISEGLAGRSGIGLSCGATGETR